VVLLAVSMNSGCSRCQSQRNYEFAMDRRILVQRQVRADLIVIRRISMSARRS
jgi:hypothetical protein